MDFTQIMQRFVRLREKFHHGELDAEAFEEQVNSMVYKDDKGRYWQIGVESGKWYYYDGEKWIQDDLLENNASETESDEIETVEEKTPDFSLEHFFANPDTDEKENSVTEEAFDQAFEAQLAAQFADSSGSQVFDLFSEEDVFANILPQEPEGDELSAPAEEVEGLAEHLLPTQPVSIESLLGEGEEISELSDQEIDFLFTSDRDVDSGGSKAEIFDEENLADLLLEGNEGTDEMFEKGSTPYDRDQKITTGELKIKAEPVSNNSIKSLLGSSFKEVITEEGADKVDKNISDELEELSEEWFGPEVTEKEYEELRWKDIDAPAPEVQALSGDEEAVEESIDLEEVYDDPDLQDKVEEDHLEFVIPEIEPEQEDPNVSPDDTPTKKKKRKWVLPVAIIGTIGVILVVILAGIYYAFILGAKGDSPLAQEEGEFPLAQEEQVLLLGQDENLLVFDDFSDNLSGWPILDDYSVGVGNYTTGFYYLYAISPDMPTIATIDASYADMLLEVETAQFKLAEGVLTTYGVMCRVQPNGDGYSFRITSDGQFAIEEYRNGVFLPINGWKYSEVIKAGQEVNQNKFKVFCNGNQLSLEVNGQVLDIAVSDTFSEGSIGLLAQTGGEESSAEVHFDNLYLRKP